MARARGLVAHRARADGYTWSHDDGPATVAVDGAPADLYLLAWGRRRVPDERFAVRGDRGLLARWVENSAL